ncbi:MAG TPA: methyltransferase [Longimicrobiales bacterium]
MPLRPNFIERLLIRRGKVPWPILDALLPTFQAAAVTAAAELGVFELLRQEALAPEELARRTDATLAGTESLLHALAGLGYVECDDRKYRLTDAADRAVPANEIRTMAPFLWELARLAGDSMRAIRDAPPGGVGDPERIQGGDIGRAFQTAMRRIAAGHVDEVRRNLKLPASARRLLDVGGAHGLHTVALCRKYPRLHGTILDWPVGIASARRTLADNPDVADRIDLVERDFERDALPDGYDVAFLGNIVHGLSPERNQALFRKLARATTPSATLVILDQVAEQDGSPFARALAGLIGFHLFVVTGGRAYRLAQLEHWLGDAGFPHVRRTPLRRAPGMSLVTARKQP